MEEQPLHKSKCMFRNFWQEYRIYDNRLELDTLVKTITTPFSEIQGVEVASTFAEGLRLHLRGDGLTLKLDWADFHKHLVLDKSTGLIRHIAFTPDDPDAFRATLDAALTRFRDRQGGKG
jgi:hypothetical protein